MVEIERGGLILNSFQDGTGKMIPN